MHPVKSISEKTDPFLSHEAPQAFLLLAAAVLSGKTLMGQSGLLGGDARGI